VVSRSPAGEGEGIGGDAGTYLASWLDLARRVRAGASFSGHEHDVAFLNTGRAGGGRFADASGAVKFDDAGDGRALAAGDWDADGDVDLWMTSRTAPRLRYLENRVPKAAGSRSLALMLVGDPARRCNRDAVGARVRLALGGAGPVDVLARSVVAGDGFLGQSSRWLHFGVPAGAAVASAAVWWPGSKGWETVAGLGGQGFFVLREGQPAEPWPVPPAPGSRAGDGGPASNTGPAIGSGAEPERGGPLRSRLSTPEPVGPVDYRGLDGSARTAPEGRPFLLMLWASWCPSCAAQMESMAGRRDGSPEVVALAVDHLAVGAADRASDAAELLAHARDHGFGGALGLADAALVERLEGLLAARFYRQDPLPLPSAFLFDSDRRVQVVYRGRFDPAAPARDVGLFGSDEPEALAQSLPFAGRGSRGVYDLSPVATAQVYLDGGYPEDARAHLLAFLEEAGEGDDGSEQHRGRLGDVYYMLGVVAAREADATAAAGHFRQAIAANPGLRRARFSLAEVLARSGDTDGAEGQLLALLSSEPADADAHVELADLRRRAGRWSEAAAGYRQALAAQPRHLQALTGLTWLLATSPDESLRDGTQALGLAKLLESSPVAGAAPVLDVVAAAYAAAGEFERAAGLAAKAAAVARAAGEGATADAIETRRQAYEEGRAWRGPERAESADRP
jgi:tetratricopeptide (TPR) repeat protein